MSAVDPKTMFQQEAQDLLIQLESALLDLSNTPDDSALIDTAFRALHTIKGSGAMFGFEEAAAFTHHVETAFDRVRQGKTQSSPELIALALRSRDHIQQLIENPAEADAAAGEELLAGLRSLNPDAAKASGAASGGQVRSGAGRGKQTWRIRIDLPRDVMANGTNPILLLDELRSLGSAIVTPLTGGIPSLQELDPTSCYIAWEVLLTTAESRQTIEDVFIFVRDEMHLEIEPAAAASGEEPAATSAAPAAKAVQQEEKPKAASAPAPAPAGQTPAAAAEKSKKSSGDTAKATASVRVPAERLDELMNRVGELVITQSRLSQVAAACSDAQVRAVTEEIERLVLELRDTTMGIRMMPIGSLFGRFRRVVHDLSRDLGKQVELVTEGEETELDKTMIEQLNDPLVHLIRNSIDHGLEDPAGRNAASKPQMGLIKLSARHAGTEVLITIADDGRGLNRERIRERAIERGLMSADGAVTDNDLFQVLFLPGFSTAAQVTSMSGRGVGMDVVKRTIEGLRGKIDLASTGGSGTEITLRLPLTTAIIDGLMVRVGQGRYVMPLGSVEECVELSEEEVARSSGHSFLNIRGEVVPFLRLRQLFQATTPADRYQKIVVVSASGMKVGLAVDQVIGEHQTVIKSLTKLHSGIEMFSGATILGDGSVALILDIPHLVEFGQISEENLRAAE
jgi:two-component system, chemotaxis family, sensor kinase CheA